MQIYSVYARKIVNGISAVCVYTYAHVLSIRKPDGLSFLDQRFPILRKSGNRHCHVTCRGITFELHPGLSIMVKFDIWIPIQCSAIIKSNYIRACERHHLLVVLPDVVCLECCMTVVFGYRNRSFCVYKYCGISPSLKLWSGYEAFPVVVRSGNINRTCLANIDGLCGRLFF